MNLLSTLPDRRAAAAPDAAAVADDSTDLNNAGFLDAVRRAAATLRAAGVSSGDVVAIMLPNTAAYVVALFAIWRVGATVTPIDPWLTAAEADHQLTTTGAKVLIAAPRPTPDAAVHVVIPADDLATADPDVAEPARPRNDTLALLLRTNGALGKLHSVTVDHANLDAMCSMVIEAFELTAADHSLLNLPLSHVNSIVVGTLSPLLADGRATVAFSPKTFFDRIERSRATYISAVPTTYALLSDLPAEIRPNTASVRFAICGAASADVELLTKFERRYGIPIVDGYVSEVPVRARRSSSPGRWTPSEYFCRAG
ncbi:class I adenylate-forming enzyme family protein [Nocardia aurantiaca]|uniref:AMP-binding protein n=1 Tax=Nocardia aurantiaca TaxID=2675850 RepID=A0A6I3L013_9NOCA|nr:AMP-binding protein [Nocardia aurantiaca]MTE16303.1 AMP-binding protein [Nocardia aurantiaca]